MNLSAKGGGSGFNPVLIILGSAVVLVGGYLISLLAPSLLPLAASAEAGPIDQLFRVMLFLGGVVFVLVEGLLILSIVRFRARKGDTSDGANFNGNVTLEVIWTAIPAIVVVFITLYSYNVWVEIQTPKNDELVIQAEGQRFIWSFTYNDPLDRLAEFPIEKQSFNDGVLHTYVGRPVRLQMTTPDVNHAFWVPTMRIKQDLLAGRTTEVAFTPTVAGRYRIVCTELCGSGHGAMFSYIQVYETEQEWLASFIDPKVDFVINPPDDPVLLGQDALASGTYPCSGCHVLDAVGWAGLTGPSLNGIGDTATRRAQTRGLPGAADYLAQSIRHPNVYLVPGYNAGVMPQFGAGADEPATVDGAYYVNMSDESLVNVVAYLCMQTATGTSACGTDETGVGVDKDLIIGAVAAQSE